jgi:hypothetical protein
VTGFPSIPAGVYADAVEAVTGGGVVHPGDARAAVDALIEAPGVLSALALAACRADPMGLAGAVVSIEVRDSGDPAKDAVADAVARAHPPRK